MDVSFPSVFFPSFFSLISLSPALSLSRYITLTRSSNLSFLPRFQARFSLSFPDFVSFCRSHFLSFSLSPYFSSTVDLPPPPSRRPFALSIFISRVLSLYSIALFIALSFSRSLPIFSLSSISLCVSPPHLPFFISSRRLSIWNTCQCLNLLVGLWGVAAGVRQRTRLGMFLLFFFSSLFPRLSILLLLNAACPLWLG